MQMVARRDYDHSLITNKSLFSFYPMYMPCMYTKRSRLIQPSNGNVAHLFSRSFAVFAFFSDETNMKASRSLTRTIGIRFRLSFVFSFSRSLILVDIAPYKCRCDHRRSYTCYLAALFSTFVHVPRRTSK
jgi:hypothetical protein